MRVLIHAAAGGVGSIAVQIARLRGATVVATCSQQNVDFVRALGAQEVFPYDQTPFEEHARDIDVVFDVIGGDVHRRSYAALKRGGTIVALAAAPFEDQSARWGVKLATPQVVSDPASLTEIVGLLRPVSSSRASTACFRSPISPRRTKCQRLATRAEKRSWCFSYEECRAREARLRVIQPARCCYPT
jgi:hypothetical protein